MEAQKFVEVASKFKVNESQWSSLPEELKKEQVALYSTLTKAEKEHTSVLKENQKVEENLAKSIAKKRQELEKATSLQTQYNNEITELITLKKTQQIDAQTFVDKASAYRVDKPKWDNLDDKTRVKLVNEITKAEREHTKVLQEEAKIERALRGEKKANVEEIKKGTLEKMKSQAASIQQRATTKKLSGEYVKQASTIRQQVEELQIGRAHV